MKITAVKLNEVHMRLDSDDNGILQELNEFFSFYMEGYRFSPKYKARMWDGRIHLYNYASRKLYCGLLPYVREFCKAENIELVVDSGLESDNKIEPQHTKMYADSLKLGLNGESIVPRAHQYMGLYHAMKQKRTCLLSPTSSGKSLIAYMIARYVLDTEEGDFLLVVPTVSLTTQMYKDFIDYSSLNGWSTEDNVHLISAGAEKLTDKRITISTWQSISKLPPSYFENFSCVLYDEAHLLKGQSLQNIADKCVNTPYRIGMTGTLDGAKSNQLVIEGISGKVRSLITTKQLMDKGEIAQLKIEVELLRYPDYMCKGARQLDYPAEIKAISGYTERNNTVCDMAIDQTKNTLLLFNTKAHGKLLFDRIKKQCPNRSVYFTNGDTSKERREEIRVLMEKEEDAILVASYGTLSTGVSIKNLHVIIFGSPSKSRIRVLQSIGRGLRLHKNKTHMILIDVVDDLSWKKRRNYSVKHFIERQNHYNTSGFDYSVNKRLIGENVATLL